MKKKLLRLGALALVLTVLGGLAAVALGAPWAFNSGSASATGGLACSVKPACGAGEVAVFRMSATTNAHAGTPGGSAYGNVVCCGGVAGLGTDCSSVHRAVVLTLSGTDNAHVASDGSYGTQVCLSVGTDETVSCRYRASCPTDYACLATISGTTNAHVADCDGANDYATKVCCGRPSVGGMVEMQMDGSGSAVDSAGSSGGSSGPNYIALAGGLAAVALLTLAAGGWYARRRRLG
ncbi:MAG: hypothetical protein MUP14_03160 [Dehalococcoidia bacterium]|nr:hypothetical protein [Dehalococcoidia bacterium]